MSNEEDRLGEAAATLREFGALCAEVAAEGGDWERQWRLLRERVNALEPEDRARLEAVMDRMLAFGSPPSRTPQ